MENPRIVLMRQGRKYRAVLWGDNDVWGLRKCLLILPEQPRDGLPRPEAVKLAGAWTPERVAGFSAGRVGSYVDEEKRETFEYLDQPPTVERVVNRVPEHTTTDKVAELITQRRAALKEIAMIDTRLRALMGAEHTMMVVEGMARPLPERVN